MGHILRLIIKYVLSGVCLKIFLKVILNDKKEPKDGIEECKIYFK